MYVLANVYANDFADYSGRDIVVCWQKVV